jgi:hypothetical protein
MAVQRLVDPNKLLLVGAITDWLGVYRRHIERVRSPKEIMAERKLERARIVQLRWLLAPKVGYPTEPFRVWRRPATPVKGETKLSWSELNLIGLHVIVFDRPQVFVRLSFQSTGGGSVLAFGGGPFSSAIVATATINAGFSTVGLSGPAIQSVVIPSGTDLQDATGLDVVAVDDPNWELVEIVGLPVDSSWSGLFDLDAPQGLLPTPGDPVDAALDRFRRGAPFYGWDEQLTATITAPPWVLADPKAMIKVMQDNMLDPLRQMISTAAPPDQADFSVDHILPLIGDTTGVGDPAHAIFQPLPTLIFGAATDPLASLISGFGTAFEDVDLPAIQLGDRTMFGDSTHSDWDFMVTAHYDKGLDGASSPIEYAAIVFAPGVDAGPPAPTNLAANVDGLRSPLGTDDDWRGVIHVAWDRLPDSLPFRVGSYAFARAQQAPAGGVEALMDPRPYDLPALQPISATTSPEEAPTGRLLALDERYRLATAPDPNALLYGLSHQDLFGLWSVWSSTPLSIGEPAVRDVSIVSTRLEVSPVPSGLCPATLVLEFAWDWATRSPERIEFVGRLYGQTRLGDPPANLAVPAGLQTSLAGGPGFVLGFDFGGAPAAVPNTGTPAVTATVQYVSLDGKTLEAGPVTPAGPRRYRVTLTGLSLDFAAAGRIGLALWARAIEHRWPGRVGGWSGQPAIASTADPRPPVILVEHEDVLLASMADAAGVHHASLDWPAAPGATGYFVYTTTEEKLLADRGLPSPLKSSTLSERLSILRDAFAADPSRRSFTRVSPQPIAANSMPVSLPRGSKEIHLYVILGVSAGQVESAWPALGDPVLRKRPIAYAAPQVVLPSPPDLEVARVLDESVMPPAYRAALRVRSKPGAAVIRVDLHRVRVPEAALLLDTMGPPIARIAGSTGDYTVTPTVSTELGVAQAIGTIAGRDAVEGSWKRVFYRAVAWAGDDPPRGRYGGRSAASALREVVVPPATPPDLSPLSWHWPGGPLADAQVEATTLAPIDETPLGPHRIHVSALAQHLDGTTSSLFSYPATPADGDRLDAVRTVPPVAGVSGLWRDSGTGALHLLLRRASTDDALQVRFLLSDPLGRSTERLIDVPPGVPIVAPDILAPTVTPVPGKGFLLQFATSAPVPPTSIGPYVLTVNWVPGLILPTPFPRPPGRGPRSLPLSLVVALPDIARARPGEDVFADPATIPVRRAAGSSGQTLIGVALRGRSGAVTVGLGSPDGRSASLRRTLL